MKLWEEFLRVDATAHDALRAFGEKWRFALLDSAALKKGGAVYHMIETVGSATRPAHLWFRSWQEHFRELVQVAQSYQQHSSHLAAGSHDQRLRGTALAEVIRIVGMTNKMFRHIGAGLQFQVSDPEDMPQFQPAMIPLDPSGKGRVYGPFHKGWTYVGLAAGDIRTVGDVAWGFIQDLLAGLPVLACSRCGGIFAGNGKQREHLRRGHRIYCEACGKLNPEQYSTVSPARRDYNKRYMREYMLRYRHGYRRRNGRWVKSASVGKSGR